MINIDALKRYIHDDSIAKFPKDKALLCLGIDSNRPKQVSEIQSIGLSAGVNMKAWNVSSILRRSQGKAIHTDKGWELSPDGVIWLQAIVDKFDPGPRPQVATTLRQLAAGISETDTRSFVTEAIECYERRLHRAAVVLSWQGAISLLYDEVIRKKLTGFNAEAQKRNPKWKQAKTRDDLARMKETDFLDILEAISLIGKSVKGELKTCLDLRNGCGHPNSLKISDYSVAAHIEKLVLNVFQVFT